MVSYYPGWRTWRCFPVLQLRCALIFRKLNPTFIACLFKGSKKNLFFLQTLLFTAFLVTVLKVLTYALVSTWSSVSLGWEHVKRKMQLARYMAVLNSRWKKQRKGINKDKDKSKNKINFFSFSKKCVGNTKFYCQFQIVISHISLYFCILWELSIYNFHFLFTLCR